MTHPLFGPVVKVRMGQSYLAAEAPDVDAVVMVLRGDLDPFSGQVLHGMVTAMVAEFKFVRPAAHRQAEDLVAEADPEYRFFPDQLLSRLYRVCDRPGVAWAVAQNYAVGVRFEHSLRRRLGGDDCHVKTCLDKVSQYIELDPEIVDDDGERGARREG